MKQLELKRIKELKEEINKLPKGYISIKKIGGNVYYYHQWNENGKKYSKFVTDDELIELNSLINKRKELENELKRIKQGFDDSKLLFATLMHINDKVVDLDISLETGQIQLYGYLYAKELLPIGVQDNLHGLSEWWNERSIPLTRSGIKDALEKLNISDPRLLLLKCFGLSLSDQYWIKPREENIAWEDVNFFDNDFSDDVGVVLFNGEKRKKELNLSSPDNTSVGNLKKRWKIVDGKRALIKGGSNPYRQEPFNEAIASEIAKLLGLNCVKYELFYDGDYPYSVCEDFVKRDQDLVTAYQINKVLKRNNSDSVYTHFVKCAQSLGIKDAEAFLDRLIVFDFIIANEDRHLNNFGFIRDAKTLEFVGPAPIFDSGASFGFDKLTIDIKAYKEIISKPFKEKPQEQLQLVKDFSWLSLESLNNIKSKLPSLFNKYQSKYLDNDRISAITDSAVERIDYLIRKYLKNK